jgi:hypothetical protein
MVDRPSRSRTDYVVKARSQVRSGRGGGGGGTGGN